MATLSNVSSNKPRKHAQRESFFGKYPSSVQTARIQASRCGGQQTQARGQRAGSKNSSSPAREQWEETYEHLVRESSRVQAWPPLAGLCPIQTGALCSLSSTLAVRPFRGGALTEKTLPRYAGFILHRRQNPRGKNPGQVLYAILHVCCAHWWRYWWFPK